MGNTMATILMMSLSGSILAAVLLLIRPLIAKHVSKAFLYYIWLPVLLRLLLPFGFGVPLFRASSAAATTTQFTDVSEADTSGYIVTAVPIDDSDTNRMECTPDTGAPTVTEAVLAETDISGSAAMSEKGFDLGDYLLGHLVELWLAGMFISLDWYILSYAVFYRRLSRSFETPRAADLDFFNSLRRTGNVRLEVSELAETPMLIGILRPTIILPKRAFSENGMERELRDILRHELTHWRRHDLLYKWLAVIVQCVHWFNPVVYIIRRELDKACELSCDEAVVRFMSPRDRVAYGNTLLALAAERAIPARITATTLGEGKKEMKSRIVSIRDHKKCSAASVVLMLVFSILLTACSTAVASVAKAEDNTPAPNDSIAVESPMPAIVENDALAIEVERTEANRSAGDGPRYGNTSGNLSNDGCAVQDGDDVYYVVPTNLGAEVRQGIIVKASMGSDDVSVIYSGSFPYRLNVVDGWIYYVSTSVMLGHDMIYRMRADGSDNTALSPINGSFHVMDMVVVDDDIYCKAYELGVENQTIYHIAASDGEIMTILALGSFSSGFAVYDNWIYYCKDNHLFRVRIDGFENETIAEGTYAYLSILDDRLYCLEVVEGNIYGMNPDGSDKTRLTDGPRAVCLNAADGWIYYADSSAIYKIAADGSASSTLCQFARHNNNLRMNLVDSWLYLTADGNPLYRVRTDGTGLEEVTVSDVQAHSVPVSIAGVPSEDAVLALRERVEAGMTGDEITRLTETIKAANLWWEQQYMWNDIFNEYQLGDPNMPAWNYFEQTGEIQIGWAYDGEIDKDAVCAEEGLTDDEFYAKYGELVVTQNDYDADDFIAAIKELKPSVRSGLLDEDLDRLITLCSDARETHDVSCAVAMYHILHDMDYFLLRYGLADVGPYLEDTGTVTKYYGSLSVWDAFSELLLDISGPYVVAFEGEKTTLLDNEICKITLDGYDPQNDLDPCFAVTVEYKGDGSLLVNASSTVNGHTCYPKWVTTPELGGHHLDIGAWETESTLLYWPPEALEPAGVSGLDALVLRLGVIEFDEDSEYDLSEKYYDYSINIE